MKKIMALAICAAMVMSLAACGGTGGTSGTSSSAPKTTNEDTDKVYTLKMTYTISGEEAVAKCAQDMADRIYERTNGKLVLENYPNGELATDTDALELAAQGSNVITFGTPDFLATYIPDLGILDGPFLFENYTQFKGVDQSEWMEGIRKELEGKGIKNLGMSWLFGSRHLTHNTGLEISKPDQLKGVRIRSAASPTRVGMIEAMGAVVTQMNWSEVYSALNQGICQGCEAPLSTLYNSKIYEVCKDISLTGHIQAIWSVNMSNDYFNSLPEEYQQILLEEVNATAEKTYDAVTAADEEFRKKLEEEGVRFTEVDYDSFAAACESVYTNMEGWTPGLYDTVKSYIK